MNKINIDTLDNLSLDESTVKPYIVEDMVYAGLTLISGSPKVGKSRFATYLANCIGTGSKVFDRLNVNSTRVLYISLDDNQTDMHYRFNEINESGSALATKKIDFLFKFDQPDDLIALIEEAKVNRSIGVVIIDLLASLLPIGSGYRKEYAMMRSLKEYAEQNGIAILCIHHNRKATSRVAVNNVTGTSGFIGASDNLIMLHKDDGGTTTEIKVFGRDIQNWVKNISSIESGLKYVEVALENEDDVLATKIGILLKYNVKQSDMSTILDIKQPTLSRKISKLGLSGNQYEPKKMGEKVTFNLNRVDINGNPVSEKEKVTQDQVYAETV